MFSYVIVFSLIQDHQTTSTQRQCHAYLTWLPSRDQVSFSSVCYVHELQVAMVLYQVAGCYGFCVTCLELNAVIAHALGTTEIVSLIAKLFVCSRKPG